MVKIRYAEYSDKEYWFGIDQHMVESEFEYKVQTKRAYILDLNDKPIGLLRYNLFWDNTPFCTLLFIEEDYQRNGYGKQLMEYWEQDMKRQGYGMLCLHPRRWTKRHSTFTGNLDIKTVEGL